MMVLVFEKLLECCYFRVSVMFQFRVLLSWFCVSLSVCLSLIYFKLIFRRVCLQVKP